MIAITWTLEQDQLHVTVLFSIISMRAHTYMYIVILVHAYIIIHVHTCTLSWLGGYIVKM